jgi:hypothetical protein
VAKIAEVTPSHPLFEQALSRIDESTFRDLFRQLTDSNRDVFVIVMAFDVPVTSELTQWG